MIRLTLNALSNPKIHLFNKSIILLGAESAQVDLILPGVAIQPLHLKIIEQNEYHILINYVNDPFVSVNGQPFGKRIIRSGDQIVIHQTTLLFETDTPPPKKEKIPQSSPPLSQYLSPLPSFSLPFEKEVEALKEEELQKTSLENYIKELERTTNQPLSHHPVSPTENPLTNRKNTVSLKDDYLRDLEDENHHKGTGLFGHLTEPHHLYQAWKWVLLFIFSLLAIAGVIGTTFYFSMSDKTEAQETKVAQGVADIAMALTYAQLNHLKPHNQNWSDVDFLKTNLQTILPDSSSYASLLDAQGQFHRYPYSLRIYTSSDLSHFLLIAQPTPSLLYWLIPQSIIVVDSRLMELRTLKEVRSLNRLLAHADPLDGPHEKEITSLVKQGELIRLSSLASESGHLDFAPPKNLAWIRPSSENLIYNAPRYYRLGQNLIEQAISLSTSKGTSQEVASLKRDVESYKELNHFVLYSDQGKKSAVLARQGLLMFAPSDTLLFGYLLFNAQGKIHQVHLLKEEEKRSDLTQVTQESEADILAFQSASEIENKEDFNKKHSDVDHNHPIYIQLQSLENARENELKPLIAALFAFVNQDLQNPRPQFQSEFQNLSHSYLMANAKHKHALKKNLDQLYQQYEDIPIQQFLAFIKELNLDQLIQQEDQSMAVVDENCQQNMEILLSQIENSQCLTELDNFIHIASTWLNFDYIKDPQELIKYQNLLRNHLLEQLESYLLSQKKNFLLKPEDREVLDDILCQERLIQPEERDFFIKEFDELLASQQAEDSDIPK